MKRSHLSGNWLSRRPRTSRDKLKHRRLTFELLDQRQMLSGLPVLGFPADPMTAPEACELGAVADMGDVSTVADICVAGGIGSVRACGGPDAYFGGFVGPIYSVYCGPDAYEQDDSPDTANTIQIDGAPQAHRLHTCTDLDWVTFTLNQASGVIIETDGPSGDTEIRLYRLETWQEVEPGFADDGLGFDYLDFIEYDNDDGSGSFSRIERIGASALAAGTYYVKVGEYGSDALLPSYTISVTTPPIYDYFLWQDWGGMWCDAEKIPGDDGAGEPTGAPGCDDDHMCWAAVASNVLEWTGWSDAQGTANCDDMFEYFQDHWTDFGGFVDHAWEWWFTANEPGEGWGEWSDPSPSDVDLAGGGFYLYEDFDDFCHVNGSDSQAMGTIVDYLRSGMGVGLHIYSDAGGGHAITCWGYQYDPGTGTYLGIHVTDSDDDKLTPTPNNDLQYYDLRYENNQWHLQGYGRNDWHIGAVLGLEPRPAGVVPNSEVGGGGGSGSADNPPHHPKGLAALAARPEDGQSESVGAELLLGPPAEATPPDSSAAPLPSLSDAGKSGGPVNSVLPSLHRVGLADIEPMQRQREKPQPLKSVIVDRCMAERDTLTSTNAPGTGLTGSPSPGGLGATAGQPFNGLEGVKDG